ncbi:PAS domain S-box protein [Fodinisporobacter ferrooxydans]|uniref:histidine kinase n=1 Tax=Fodinisporobacter ferrooxydans TaxID=2901836 RepID=A0ABY4CKD1_9BACL|nr:PAS domain S-box protein [Alicyclobacillaceae bacterium MYW30-H2]
MKNKINGANCKVVYLFIFLILSIGFSMYPCIMERMDISDLINIIFIGFIVWFFCKFYYTAQFYKKKSEQSLELLEHAADCLNVAIWSRDVRRNSILISTGGKVSEFLRKNYNNNPNFWKEITHPDDRDYLNQMEREILITGKSKQIEYRVFDPVGEVRWIMNTIIPVADMQGTINQIHGFTFDITERKKIEEELKATQEQLASFFENTADAIVMVDLEGHIVQVNNAFESIFGWSAEEAIGNKIPIIPKNFMNCYEEIKRQVISGERLSMFEGIGQHKDGSYIHVSATISPVRDHKGNVVAIAAIIRNITDWKKSQEKLIESEERYRLLVELSPEAIVLHKEGIFTYINRAGVKLLGAASADDIIGTPILKFIHPDFREIARKRFEQVLKEKKPIGFLEEKLIRLDGQVLDVEVNAVAIYFNGDPLTLVVARDITDTKKLSEEQKRSEELEYTLKERERLARDLHDTVVQDLAYMNMKLKFVAKRIDVYNPAELKRKLNEISEVLDQSHLELRQTLHNLNVLHGELQTLVQDMLNAMKWRTGITTHLQTQGTFEDLNDHLVTEIVRIIQEGLTNVRKHAKATRVDVQLLRSQSQLLIRIQDNGCGFDIEKVDTEHHFGLRSIHKRCQSINGVAILESSIRHGTTWTCIISMERTDLKNGKRLRLHDSSG